MAVKKNIQFKLIDIETLQFAVLKENYEDNCDVGLKVGVPIKADDIKQTVLVGISIQFSCKEKPFIILEVACDFEIKEEDFNSFYTSKKKNSDIELPMGLCRHLATITAGTARGVLHEKLKKTNFEEFILPTIDLTKILYEDVVLSKEELQKKPSE
ncbi:hypothetical protein FKX85_01710 [Echinicola soli]|uniref:Preprotein translocase subunit SecB n=1 Tax=Echinicola soli TaxID=2591634 RepID=A0A514CDD0_9BACT|nr:hypothetical protein [Echinicola soli]QDH77828.1 hypothetical protein FKX85_01710 [Echinicola soli]